MNVRQLELVPQKNVALEGLRGIAAIAVVLWHCTLGFFPSYAGEFPELPEHHWRTSPFFFLMNGPAAVYLFFVLSAYVLTRRFFEIEDGKILLVGILKRWPRLMGPVLASTMLSYFLFKLDLFRYEQAAEISHSPWLAKFGWGYVQKPQVTFESAFLQGSIWTFFRGDSWLNSSLWSMRPEFFGGVLAFAFAPIIFAAKKKSKMLFATLVGIVILMAHFGWPAMVAFILGVILAATLKTTKSLATWKACGLGVFGFYLLGYSTKDLGAYQAFEVFQRVGLFNYYPAMLGAVLLIYTIESNSQIHRFLSHSFFAILGEFSFPIYLSHLLVICTVGSTLFLEFGPFIAVLGTLLVTPLISIPFVFWNRWWVAKINGYFKRI